ncbi:hypothetical protein [Roseibium sp. MMSF_3544]|uniref:hypothetical protein n=1 Tax=unclassified Roseibium TaxID=2629323 RepID=UPI00273FF5C8|nr:hypothetical protein [Roseibium sp. MMSF_3544]
METVQPKSRDPKETVEDGYALNLAILFIVGCATVFSIYLYHNNGAKYWLLNAFGKVSSGTVLTATQAAYEANDPDNYEKNVDLWTSAYVMVVRFTPEGGTPQILSFKKPQDIMGGQIGSEMEISYFPLNPKIGHPAKYVPNLRLDGYVLLGSIFAGLIAILLSVRGVRRWARFRKKMRRY